MPRSKKRRISEMIGEGAADPSGQFFHFVQIGKIAYRSSAWHSRYGAIEQKGISEISCVEER